MKNKNATFGKSLDNLTEKQFHFLKSIRGGDVSPGGGISIGTNDKLPTIAWPGHYCPNGYVWDANLNQCVRALNAVGVGIAIKR